MSCAKPSPVIPARIITKKRTNFFPFWGISLIYSSGGQSSGSHGIWRLWRMPKTNPNSSEHHYANNQACKPMGSAGTGRTAVHGPYFNAIRVSIQRDGCLPGRSTPVSAAASPAASDHVVAAGGLRLIAGNIPFPCGKRNKNALSRWLAAGVTETSLFCHNPLSVTYSRRISCGGGMAEHR